MTSKSTNSPATDDREVVEQAVEAGIAAYANSRRALITPFIDEHFSFRGAWDLNKKAFGLDLLRAPVNLGWTPIYFFVKGGAVLAGKAGLSAPERLVENLPAGMRTDVEREIEWFIYSEFLELPYRSEERVTDKNALLAHVLQQKELVGLIEGALRPLGNLEENPQLRKKLERKLTTYVDNRKDVAELTTAIVATTVGLAANKTLNMGAIGLGQTAAVAISHSMAVSGFIFGPTLGGLFYSALPWLAAPSRGLMVGATLGVAAVMGVVSAFAGVIADPAQRALGLHHKKLHRLVDSVERQFLKKGSDEYKLREGMVARLLDLLDVLYSVRR